jgi:hypothetical protein
MSISRLLMSAASVAVLSISAAHASGTLIPIVPVSGAQGTSATAISDNLTIAGSYADSEGGNHGFVGSLSGDYSTFDFTGGTQITGTFPRGVDNGGNAVGYASTNNSAFITGYSWERYADSTMVTIEKGNGSHAVPLDGIPQQLTNTRFFAGGYWTQTPSISETAYMGRDGKWKQDLALSFDSPFQTARGIDNNGDTIVGFFIDTDTQNDHGFILQGDTQTQIDFPDVHAVGTALEGVNNKGLVSGLWTDGQGNTHAFTYNIQTSGFENIRVPNQTWDEAFGINDNNDVTIISDQGSFIWCPHVAANCPTTGGGPDVDSPEIRGNAQSVRVMTGIHKSAGVNARPSQAVTKRVLAAMAAVKAKLPRGAQLP